MEKETYLRPEVETAEVRVERGYAGSTLDGEVESFDREAWNE